MPCYSLMKNGRRVGFITGDLGPHCADCGAPADNLCDFPVGEARTCDRSLCDDCAHRVGVDIHYCSTHKHHWDKFRKDGGVKKVLENVTPFK